MTDDFPLSNLPLVYKGWSDAIWTPSDNQTQTATLSLAAAKGQERSLTPSEQYQTVIAVNAAVSAYQRNIPKAKWRIFTKAGEEVEGGDLVRLLSRPNSYQSMRRLTSDIVSWYLIFGEYAVFHKDGANPQLHVRAPHRLSIEKPKNKLPNHRGDVIQWKWIGWDGETEFYRDDRLWFDAQFNPTDPVRGLSPLIVGQMTASAIHATAKYNKNFFDNSAIPSHLVVLGEGVPRAQREDFERRYLAQYSTFASNAHKVMVVSGKDVSVEKLEQSSQEGAFMELSKWNVHQVAMLYHVPAIEMGIYDKTRFDTAAEERKLFMESGLMPVMDSISESFQYQVAESYRYSEANKRKAKMSKGMSDLFEKARSEREDSAYVVLLDPDTLPIAGDVNLARVQHAKDLRETFVISPRKAEEFVGLDFDDERPERDELYLPKTHQNITHPEKNPEFMLAEKQAEAKAAEAAAKPAAEPKPSPSKSLTPEQRATAKSIDRFLRELRKTTLERIDEPWSLAEADELLAKYTAAPEAKKAVRALRHAIREAREKETGADARREMVREIFNGIDGKSILLD